VTPILATKLYLPRLRPNVVSRPRLLERLNAGLHRKLTLISAPAGSGKTTLISQWVEGIERPMAWLSLDEGENDPARLLAYLVDDCGEYWGRGIACAPILSTTANRSNPDGPEPSSPTHSGNLWENPSFRYGVPFNAIQAPRESM
jgi:ATP/maltotriose-dependent transcriptional regulator MalT